MSGDAGKLRALAEQCRQLSRGVSTPGVADSLIIMAKDYDVKASKAEADAAQERPVPPSPMAG